MGVLYHQRDPLRHLRELSNTLRPGGQLVLETLFLPGDDLRAATPPGRYARMRNVWLLPTVPQLLRWIEDSGYTDIAVVDTSITTVEEQRSTEWMTFESLPEALDPADPGLTVEGWPAPRRVVVTATAADSRRGR
jgi:tRNA (mo5U34)-methyltransferase